MQKLHCICLAIFILNISLSVQAEEKRYVSDDLMTYVHSGPGNQYRILGSLKAGEPVTLLNTNPLTQYAQIRDKKGRIFWIQANQLSQTPGQRSRLPELEQKIKTLTDELNEAHDRLKERDYEMQKKIAISKKLMEDLKTENKELKEQLLMSNEKINEAKNNINHQKHNIMMKWLTYGGIVAGTGFIFGLLLPYFIPRRKKNYRWMN